MTPKNIKVLLYQTQNLMYGFNYEVNLGLEVFEQCFSIQDAKNAISSAFPVSNMEELSPIVVTVEEFWQDINDKFDYRGDGPGVSLELNKKQEIELKKKQSEIEFFLSQYTSEITEIYSFPFLEGLPSYPVFWEYSYVILNAIKGCVFFYGSASD